jgi:hypothetical protein
MITLESLKKLLGGRGQQYSDNELEMEGTPFVRHIVYGVRDIADCIKQAAFLI